jgi:hypothetical protein
MTIRDQGVDLQYWFFYPYNGSIGGVIAPLGFSGAHEGDWEHVTVRISDYADPKKRKIRGVFFAAHGSAEGAWMVEQSNRPTDGSYSVLPGTTHPIVYAAYHSHASNEDSGLQMRRWYYFTTANDLATGGVNFGPNGATLAAVDRGLLPDDKSFTDKWWNSRARGVRTAIHPGRRPNRAPGRTTAPTAITRP